MKTETVNIKIEQSLYEQMEAEAAKSNMTTAQFIRSALMRQIAESEKREGAYEPEELEPHVKTALDKFILGLFPLVGEFYATPTKMKALPEFHIFVEGKNIGVWPIYYGSPHFQYPPELQDED